ncbi:Glycosyltransferase [Candidatus Hepatincola sp. Pdp]
MKKNILIVTHLHSNGGVETRLFNLLNKLTEFNVIIAVVGNNKNCFQPIIKNKNFTLKYFDDVHQLNESLENIITSFNINLVECQLVGFLSYKELNYNLLKLLGIKIVSTIHFNVKKAANRNIINKFRFYKFKIMLKKYFDLIIVIRPLTNTYLKHHHCKFIPNTACINYNPVYKKNDNPHSIIISRIGRDNIFHIEKYIKFLQKNNFSFSIAGNISNYKELRIKNNLITKYNLTEEQFIGKIDTLSYLKNNNSSYMFICGIGTVVLEAITLGYPVLLASILKNSSNLTFLNHSNYSKIKDNNFTLCEDYKFNNANEDLQKLYQGKLKDFLLGEQLQKDQLEPDKIGKEYQSVLQSLLKT